MQDFKLYNADCFDMMDDLLNIHTGYLIVFGQIQHIFYPMEVLVAVQGKLYLLIKEIGIDLWDMMKILSLIENGCFYVKIY